MSKATAKARQWEPEKKIEKIYRRVRMDLTEKAGDCPEGDSVEVLCITSTWAGPYRLKKNPVAILVSETLRNAKVSFRGGCMPLARSGISKNVLCLRWRTSQRQPERGVSNRNKLKPSERLRLFFGRQIQPPTLGGREVHRNAKCGGC